MPPDPSSSEKSKTVAAEPFCYAAAGEDARVGSHALGVSWGPVPAQSGNNVAAEVKAYEKGLAEGEARARSAFEKVLADTRGQVAATVGEFAKQREAYFEKVEPEIVALALAIARKILHRESQMDPLLLTGVVRVALESLNDGTAVRMRVNPQEIRYWRDYYGQATDILPAPELIGDAALPLGHCVLETEMGSTEISLETQIKEIEQGFLDLLEQRPRN